VSGGGRAGVAYRDREDGDAVDVPEVCEWRTGPARKGRSWRDQARGAGAA
jgi:hypothetical protein